MQELKLEELNQDEFDVSDEAVVDGGLDSLDDVEVNITVVIGSFDMSLAALRDLRGGQIVTLDQHVGDPVSLQHNGKELATGTLVADEGKLAIELDSE